MSVVATVDAVYQGGVFKPVDRPDIPEGEHVRLTIERVGRSDPDDILRLATRVYEGLSAVDVDEVEEMARRRTFFADTHH